MSRYLHDYQVSLVATTAGPSSAPPPTKESLMNMGAVGNGAIVPDRNQFADERVSLNPAALTYLRRFLYLDEWPNEAVISNCATTQIDWLYDGDVPTELNIDNP